MLRREQIERLKERYPAGTVVRLGQMEGEHQMPSGMEGKVIDVDDIGQIHVEWENGSTLALNVEEDDYCRTAEGNPVRKEMQGVFRESK